MRPHLTRPTIKIDQTENVNKIITAVKNDIKENILTPEITSNIKTMLINLFGLFLIFAMLYLFYQVCLDNYENKYQQGKEEIFAYNFVN